MRETLVSNLRKALSRPIALIFHLSLFSIVFQYWKGQPSFNESDDSDFDNGIPLKDDQSSELAELSSAIGGENKTGIIYRSQITNVKINLENFSFVGNYENDDAVKLNNNNEMQSNTTILNKRNEIQLTFVNDSSISPESNPRRHYSWSAKGIEFTPLLRYMNDTFFNNNVSEQHWYERHYGPIIGFVTTINNSSKPKIWFARSVIRLRAPEIRIRLKNLYPHFHQAVTVTLHRHARFHAIWNALLRGKSFPFLLQLDDFTGCLKDNYRMPSLFGNEVKSLPILTMAREVGCPYYFPIPSYASYKYAAIPKHESWDTVFTNWSSTYKAMKEKIPKVFWRGSCTGKPHRRKFIIKAMRKPHLDCKMTMDCNFRSHASNVKPPEESMKYRAVFDIDGNSWSERFSRLMCYNSVVIKVNTNPDFEEYYMPDLIPGVHYLPASLENFTKVALWAVQNSSVNIMMQIVRNANSWCKGKLQHDVLNFDFLSTLNGYLEGLFLNDNNWIDRWSMVKSIYLSTQPYALRP
jgi:Glycosyl transferase family 90